jgi:hypothetical protein
MSPLGVNTVIIMLAERCQGLVQVETHWWRLVLQRTKPNLQGGRCHFCIDDITLTLPSSNELQLERYHRYRIHFHTYDIDTSTTM